MPGLSRKKQLLFAGNAIPSPTDVIAQFGSLAAGTPTFTSDPFAVQELNAWLEGWSAATINVGGQPVPPLQDMNALFYVAFYQLAYIISRGMADWDTGTIYNQYDFCKVAGVLYVSQSDANTGNDPTTDSGTNWKPYLQQTTSPAIPKAWLVFNGISGATFSGFNISNIVQISTGVYTVTYATPLAAGAGFIGTCSGIVRPRSQTTNGMGQVTSQTFDTAGESGGLFSPTQYPYVTIQAFSN